jgi:hypothetical protein
MSAFKDQTLDIDDLTGGINDFFTADKIEDNQWAYARNIFGYENSVKSRSGYRWLSIGSLSAASRTVKGMGQIQAGSNNYNFAAWNHQLFSLGGVTPQNVSATRIKNNFNTTGGSGYIGFDFFPFSGTKNVVICNGIQTPVRWDGTSAGVVNLSGSAAATADDFKNFNRYGLLYDFDALSIQRSNLGDANAGYGANTPYVIPSDKIGDIGSGFIQFGDELIVTTRRSLHKLIPTGVSSAPFIRKKITGEIGNLSHRALCAIDNGILFVDYTGIYFYDGINLVRASQPIQGTFSQLNQEYLIYASAVNYKPRNWVLFSVPYGSGQTTNNLILAYDYLNSVPFKGKFVWWIFDNITAQSMGIFRNSNLVDQWWTGDNSARLYLQDSGTNDAGAAFTQEGRSKAYDFKKPHLDKRLHECRFFLEGSGNWNLTTMYDVDLQNAASNQRLLSLFAGGNLWGSFTWGTDSWATQGVLTRRLKYATTLRGRTVQFQFKINTVDQFFRLYRYLPAVSFKNARGRDVYTA